MHVKDAAIKILKSLSAQPNSPLAGYSQFKLHTGTVVSVAKSAHKRCGCVPDSEARALLIISHGNKLLPFTPVTDLL